MKKRRLVSVADILEEVFKDRKSVLSDGYFLCQLVCFWREIAGESIAKTGRPVKAAKGELTVSLPSSCHLQEMQFIKEDLLKEINRRFPERKIRRIRLKVQERDPIDIEQAGKILS